MPKANGYAKIAKRILILHSRANKLQADLLTLESLVSAEAQKLASGPAKKPGATKAARPKAADPKSARAKKPATAAKAARPATAAVAAKVAAKRPNGRAAK